MQLLDKSVGDCLAALKFVPHWFVTSKMIKKVFTALHANGNILCFNKDSNNLKFCCNEMGILSVNLNNINHDDSNYREDDPDTIILIKLLAWNIKFEKRKKL